jgi:hypothetical protein
LETLSRHSGSSPHFIQLDIIFDIVMALLNKLETNKSVVTKKWKQISDVISGFLGII